MRLHHLGLVGRNLAVLQRRLLAESAVELTPPVEDPVQRVVVQFFREPRTGEVWELIVPLGDVADSPLASRLARGGGLDHVCYELEAEDGSIDDAVAAERGAGAMVMCAPVHAAAFGRRVAFVLRRSGRLVEYVEARAPGAVV